METKFQTSFIPKKPLMAQESAHVPSTTSVFMVIAIIIFILSLGAAGFTFIAKGLLLKSQETAKVNLAENEKRFDLPLIEKIKNANLKIDLANQLLKNHVAASEALAMVAGLTAEKVHFSSFEFTSGAIAPALAIAAPAPAAPGQSPAESVLPSSKPQPVYQIKMKGITDTFNSVAFQSDVFGNSSKYGTNKVLKNPVLSDLIVDQDGNVTFNFGSDISLSDISYEKALTRALQTGN
jgi:hypothetical protein